MFISDTIDKVSMSAIVMDIDSTTVAEIRKSAVHEVIKESENKSCVYMRYRKSMTSFHWKLFPIFKNVFLKQ